MAKNIREEFERWGKTTLNKVISKAPEREPSFKTTSHIELKRLYTPLDVADLDYCDDLGFPGESPFTRGVQPTMYRGRLWTMRQYAGFATPEETNKRYKYLLEHGQTGLSVAFDLPTQIGYDSDHPLSDGEVGKVGVAIDTLKDVEILFDGIPLDKVSTSMTINSTAAILLTMYIAVAEKNMRQGEPTSTPPSNRCALSPTFLRFVKIASLDGIASALAVIICVRQVARLSRKWPLL
jgi:methylmalonyl-CoA mutase N-terminal domain/subunit